MKLEPIIDKILLEESQEKHKRSGLYSPSSFGRCFRYQYWHMLDVPKTNFSDAQALRVMSNGKIIHRWIQNIIKKQYPEAILEEEVTTHDCHTFIDVVLPDRAIEIKTCHPWMFKHMEKGDFILSRDQKPHFLQAVHGAMVTDKDYAQLIYIERQNLLMKEFIIPITGETAWKVDEELATLREIKIKNWLPEPIPRAFEGKECCWGKKNDKFCPYYNKCKGVTNGDNPHTSTA